MINDEQLAKAIAQVAIAEGEVAVLEMQVRQAKRRAAAFLAVLQQLNSDDGVSHAPVGAGRQTLAPTLLGGA